MTIDEVLDVAEGSPVRLTDGALAVISRSRSVVDDAIAHGEAIYGATTGVGHARNDRVDLESLEALQPILVEMHMGAMGEPMPREAVRAGMVVRLNGFARGGSGVSPEVARLLEAMLNNQVHPIIPRTGSVGSGDLGQLAFLGRAMLGRGEVDFDGRVVDCSAAFRETGIKPVSLKPKDALAIISSNALTIGNGILLQRSVERLLKFADLVAALSMETIGANPSVFEPVVAAARGSRGQIDTSKNLASVIEGSARVDAETASVQDPLSFRVIPQVHGACRDVLTTATGHLLDELNASSDNPLVDIDSNRVISNGNFQAMNVALSAESLNLALGHVALLSQRRSGHIWDATVAAFGTMDAVPPASHDGAPPHLAGLGLRYPAAARYTRLRQLVQPMTLDVPNLDLSVEDHSTNAAEALQSTTQIVELMMELLTVEALVAVAAMTGDSTTDDLGSGTSALFELITGELSELPTGAPPHVAHERVLTSVTTRLDELIDLIVATS